ncbi:DUF6663 family protein [Halobaculum marinum]|uniref:DUF6663 family protein n=1 Tax=Halobaculum marinum TaxID=3031996 RepID=A0ABD5X0G6_9EURY|nr:DUF6663 family protein [Halobaculum sp. DT55]
MDGSDGPADDDSSTGNVDPWADDADDDWVEDATDTDRTDTADTAATADAAGTESAADASARDTPATEAPVDGTTDGDATGLGPRRYRVLDRDDDALVFVDLDTPDPGPGPAPDVGFEPVRVAATPDDATDSDDGDRDGNSDLESTLDSLSPGYVVTASLRWPDPESGHPRDTDDAAAAPPLARVESVTIERESRYWFADGVEPMFEAARETWEEARAAGEGMGSRVTRDTDGEPNGALYVFAEAGARDLLGEFRSGTTPLEPLVDRVNDDLADDDPREVFVLRPAEGGYVVVYIAFRADGVLARTVRDTYC